MFILKIQKVEKSSNSCLRSPGMLFIFPSLINCSKQTYLTVLGNYYIYMSNNRINNNLYYTVIAVWNKLKQIEIPILNVPMCTHLATRLLKDFLHVLWISMFNLETTGEASHKDQRQGGDFLTNLDYTTPKTEWAPDGNGAA